KLATKPLSRGTQTPKRDSHGLPDDRGFEYLSRSDRILRCTIAAEPGTRKVLIGQRPSRRECGPKGSARTSGSFPAGGRGRPGVALIGIYAPADPEAAQRICSHNKQHYSFA